MNVAELIEALSALPQTSPVMVDEVSGYDGDTEPAEVKSVEIGKLARQETYLDKRGHKRTRTVYDVASVHLLP